MIKVESLKDYIQNTNEEEFMNLTIKIYMITDFICEDYPKYKEWYFNKQLSAINSEKRNILFVRNPDNQDDIIAMACLKKEKVEKKICTLYVSYKYRGLGIGTAIIEEAFKWLETTKPLITITDYKLDMFKPIIDKYNWELTEIVSGLYNNSFQELCFNGSLIKNNNNTLEQRLQKRLVKTLKHIQEAK